MSVHLLDVNVLVSLLDSAHVHHTQVVSWFHANAAVAGWATTPITENGFIRVVSGIGYPNMRVTAAQAAASLAQLKKNFSRTHHSWALDLSLTDNQTFDLTVLTGARQTTDAWLAGLAFRHGGRIATLDNGIPWRAVRGADVSLVEKIAV